MNLIKRGIGMKNITAKEVETLIKQGEKLNIIDVRETGEVRSGKIPSAINIPLGLLEFRMNELERSQEYIVVCHSGGRSAMATRLLENYGYKVTNMVGGMLAWEGPLE